MNLRERLQVRVLVNLIISVIERLVNLIVKLSPPPKPVKPDGAVIDPKPKRPLKKIVDTIDSVVPWPWRKKDE